MSKVNDIEDFNRDVVFQITEGGYPVPNKVARLGISKFPLYEWRKRYAKPSAIRDNEQAASGQKRSLKLPFKPTEN
jgi:transposase